MSKKLASEARVVAKFAVLRRLSMIPLPSGSEFLECARERILRHLVAAEDAHNLDLWNHLWCELAKINHLIEVNP